MDIVTTAFVSTMQKHAREKYDISFAKKRDATLASVQSCFTEIQDSFKKDKKFPINAYSRTINYPGEPDKLEKNFLQEMGFELGKKIKGSYGDRDGCEYTYTRLLIPKNEEGVPFTTAQRLYEEHVAKINEILADVLKNDSNKLSAKALNFVMDFLCDLEKGFFEGHVINASPHCLKISKKKKASYYIRYSDVELLERFVYNLLVSKGIVVENGFFELKCECHSWEDLGSFIEIEMLVQIPN